MAAKIPVLVLYNQSYYYVYTRWHTTISTNYLTGGVIWSCKASLGLYSLIEYSACHLNGWIYTVTVTTNGSTTQLYRELQSWNQWVHRQVDVWWALSISLSQGCTPETPEPASSSAASMDLRLRQELLQIWACKVPHSLIRNRKIQCFGSSSSW